MLTDVQSAQINNTEVYTLDYEAEAMQSYRDTGEDLWTSLRYVLLMLFWNKPPGTLARIWAALQFTSEIVL